MCNRCNEPSFPRKNGTKFRFLSGLDKTKNIFVQTWGMYKESQDEIPSVSLFQVSYLGSQDNYTVDIKHVLHWVEYRKGSVSLRGLKGMTDFRVKFRKMSSNSTNNSVLNHKTIKQGTIDLKWKSLLYLPKRRQSIALIIHPPVFVGKGGDQNVDVENRTPTSRITTGGWTKNSTR